MKKILFILSILCCQLCYADIIINKDTTVNNIWVIPKGTIVRFESGGHIHGTGTIYGGIIQASLKQWIFDTTLIISPEALYNTPFSASWFGANPLNADNYNQLQKAINTVIANYNSTKELIILKGTYSYSKSLKIATLYKGSYVGTTIHLYGEGGHWESGEGTTLKYTGKSGFALGGQVLKGAEIDHLSIVGQFKAPQTPDNIYYNTPYEKFEDSTEKCEFWYHGLVIDYDGTKNWSGSTGVNIHDVRVSNFSFLISISPNGVTPNAEGLVFTNITFGDGRVGFANGQAQEKGNTITNVMSWGRLHTIFYMGYFGKTQAGNYYLNGGNIAGKNVRFINCYNASWYTTTIRDFFCESLREFGTIISNLPVEISNSTFHFVPPNIIGDRNVVTTNNSKILFNTCIFRYYGTNYPVRASGGATYRNCTPIVNAQAIIN